MSHRVHNRVGEAVHSLGISIISFLSTNIEKILGNPKEIPRIIQILEIIAYFTTTLTLFLPILTMATEPGWSEVPIMA